MIIHTTIADHKDKRQHAGQECHIKLYISCWRCDSRISDLAARVEAIGSWQCQQVTIDVSASERTVAGLRSELNDYDQDMLCNDLEIAGVPEEKKRKIYTPYTQRSH
ncbi:hypothetical protein EVAR_41867_1 [Eumeta japonica]|uniref:Uncharacterized protein n=1 Tax=Eumeta variegata TaxID=151549 RepID=A0A4C1X8T2_EUMVA|nr:hypothetical protein EVAR_41867_1 [Eumeta japonica]